MSKKFFLSFLLLFIVGIPLVFTFIYLSEQKAPVKKVTTEKKISNKTYRYRKYIHVKNFYKSIAQSTIKLALKYDVPPAAILAMAGVESGYGRGYVARITGNILSLGAKTNEPELPALYLPNLKSDKSKIIYGDMINKYPKDALEWKKRPKSLKKDYRPKNIAATPNELDFFDKNPQEKNRANLACIEDFVKIWIHKNKKLKPFVKARVMLDEQVKLHTKDILFDRDLNIRFLYMISGKENSFNYRKTWAPKVVKIMENVGLVELVYSLHVEHKNFENIW